MIGLVRSMAAPQRRAKGRELQIVRPNRRNRKAYDGAYKEYRRLADQFQATIIWMHEEPMLRGRPYIIKVGTRTLTGSITTPKYKVNVNTLERLAAKQLELRDLGVET